jgi:hypothetical protein
MGPRVTLSGLGLTRRGTPEVEGNFTKLAKFIRLWDALELEVGTDAPTNVTEWFLKVKAAKARAKQLPKAPRLNGPYLLCWHIRALLRDRMVSAGIPKLAINPECTIYQLMNLCPDQSGFLFKVYQYLVLVQGKQGMTTADFVKFAATADTPPELLSMWQTSCTHYGIHCNFVDLS